MSPKGWSDPNRTVIQDKTVSIFYFLQLISNIHIEPLPSRHNSRLSLYVVVTNLVDVVSRAVPDLPALLEVALGGVPRQRHELRLAPRQLQVLHGARQMNL